ncbi:MAG: bifunctional glutamate N-acetyltransferase/amino-acid acetyltransferase ArgJ [Actinomycetota bacterium]|nr:bifunctional glutamate N-acetyltransferase/amino-acid acetyltransferase ArgJ [Actinomycetota bacterium]
MNQSSDTNIPAPIDGGVTAPMGFSACGVAAGLKPVGALDFALVVADSACPAAAVFSTNKVAAAPVVLSRKHITSGRAKAVVINAGNANACTGAAGERNSLDTAEALAAQLGCEVGDVQVCSTGVIGVQLPVERLLRALPGAVASLAPDGGAAAAQAIMTTDTAPKEVAVELSIGDSVYRVGGMAKGSGMIQPNMATMLAVLTTDAPLSADACDAVLRSAVNVTFNRVTVDSDTSTNDTCVLMASGAAGGDAITPTDERFSAISVAVHAVAEALACKIARDGEGASKLITVTVHGAESEPDAELAAFAIANSPLVKTAIFGRDANWGRVAMAIGKSGCELDPARFDITFAGIRVCSAGAATGFDEDAAYEALGQSDVSIEVDLNLGEARASVWTCDLTYDYVRINGEYRS